MQDRLVVTDLPTTSWQMAGDSFHPNGRERRSQVESARPWTRKVPQADSGSRSDGKQFVRSSLMSHLLGEALRGMAAQRMNLCLSVCKLGRTIRGLGSQWAWLPRVQLTIKEHLVAVLGMTKMGALGARPRACRREGQTNDPVESVPES